MATKENMMQSIDVAQMIDHTLLKATATSSDVEKLCQQAIEYGFYSVCLPSSFLALAGRMLKHCDVKIGTVIGFPLGNSNMQAKASEAHLATSFGASEIDMVINIGALKSNQPSLVGQDILAVVESVPSNVIVKVILETCYLTDKEIVQACQISKNAGAHFVKTSTGFGTGGATVENVRLMRETVGPNFGVKASGGIRNYQSFHQMVAAGANRIGCSSGVEIVNGQKGSGY